MESKDIIQKLNAIATRKPSKWIEKAKKRETSRDWSMKSAKIALLILNEIKTRKISQEMSQKMLAEKMGVSAQYVNKILKGQENLSLETISKIEKALGITLIEIPSYDDNQKAEDFISNDFNYSQILHVYSKKFEFSNIKEFYKTPIIIKSLHSNQGLSNKIEFPNFRNDTIKKFIIYQSFQSIRSIWEINCSDYWNESIKKSEPLKISESENIFA